MGENVGDRRPWNRRTVAGLAGRCGMMYESGVDIGMEMSRDNTSCRFRTASGLPVVRGGDGDGHLGGPFYHPQHADDWLDGFEQGVVQGSLGASPNPRLRVDVVAEGGLYRLYVRRGSMPPEAVASAGLPAASPAEAVAVALAAGLLGFGGLALEALDG